MSFNEPLHPFELRNIFLPAAGRNAALSLKIPSLEERATWTSAGRIIKYFPSFSLQHQN
ncbi:Uncharacterized protein FKW44_002594 [Caligus rogercresseyi]|uniref:Uncharacterized protein n=1 Tax=Caligus rogercresseyi TaxID=217165 RepID=A0A7T8KKU3_CALRO|nr:Uncharacterized protein FKW44_002594 [Caligus rogercresseyi]